MKSKDKPKHFLQRTFVSGILFLLLLFLFVSSTSPDLNPSFSLSLSKFTLRGPKKLNLEEGSDVSIQLNKKTIQASSLKEQVFPLLVSWKIPEIEPSYGKPVDLICVIKLQQSAYYPLKEQIQGIKKSFHQFLPWMTDQDRLSIVLFGRSSYVDSLVDNFSVPGSKIPPLVNTTRKNKKRIISALGENILNGEMTIERALEAAMAILNQRNATNRTTGIFILTPPNGEIGYEIAQSLHNAIIQVDLAKENLGLQDKGFIIQPFLSYLTEFGESFAESFAILQAGVVETQFLVKPEQSQVLKNVEIEATYYNVWYEGWMQNGAFIAKSPSVKPGLQQELAFDLKIPRITNALSSSPMEVKVASCQLIFSLIDGSQVVRNADLTVKIIREGEEFVDEEESREATINFYRKWGENWLFPTARTSGHLNGYESARKLLKVYRESLEGSIVKHDEMLQRMLREAEERVDREEKYGIIYCY